MARLIFENGPWKSQEYNFKKEDEVILGRSKANYIPIPDIMVSRHHARIYHKDESWWIEDLNSRNGVMVNGDLKKQSQCQFGDCIQLGNTILRFEDSLQGEWVGQKIAGYKLLERIGKGGMGEVYRAYQISLDRVVAIKILSEKLQENKKTIDNFIREARRAGSLSHPNIIHVHDVGQTQEGLVYFSMEYVEGPTLKQILADFKQKEKKIPLPDLCRIFADIANALHYAHTCSIVHRDIKPDNIMLTQENEVKLADLGIAQEFGKTQTQKKSKRRILGTPYYMAPEQILGRPVDGRLDIYSLGATAYHIFTGHVVFRGKTAQEIVKAHLQVAPTPARDLNPDLPDEIEKIIMKMLAKKPSDRYQQAYEVAQDFTQAHERLSSGQGLLSFFDRFKRSRNE